LYKLEKLAKVVYHKAMNRIEKLAGYALFGVVFIVAGLNLILALGGSLRAWNLPALYAVYLLGVFAWRTREGFHIKLNQLVLAVLVPALFLFVAYGLGNVYDTSWDGQDYQSSAVIELAKGWNPWHSSPLPVSLPVSQEYVVGYPKSTWLLQASVYVSDGHMRAAIVTNVILAATAGILVFAALRRLKISKTWAWIITVLAVCGVHFLQQMPTFMADGYSYELCLIAIAGFTLLAYDAGKKWPLAVIFSAWLLLAGGKFSNLFICAVIAVVVATYLYRLKAYKMPDMRALCLGFLAVAALVLWVPYGTNTVHHHSPLYPQNQPNEGAKLRYDNVPNNLKQANRAKLLFYGIYASTEPSDAGNPKSAHNVARLKVPFTWRNYEIHEANNFQGRVGSGGFLFSGIFSLGLLVLLAMWATRPQPKNLPTLTRLSMLIGLILLSALVLPVPNKLRYSPLITLIPLLVVVGIAALRGKRPAWLRAGAITLTLLIVINTAVTGASLLHGRLADAHAIHTQLQQLKRTNQTYDVYVGNFYSNFVRLQEAGIPVRRVRHPTCNNPIQLQSSYGTTLLCAIKN